MTRKLLLTIPLLFLFAFPAQAQKAQPDSVTISFEALQGLQEAHKEMKRKVEIQDSIITEQERQIQLWQARAKQDSLIQELAKERAKVIKQRMKLRDEQIKELKRDNFWLRIKQYAYMAGGILLGIVTGGFV